MSARALLPHLEEQRRRDRARYASNADLRRKKRERAQEWARAHPDARRAIRLAWTKRHPERAHAWREANRRESNIAERRRRAALPPGVRAAEVARRRATKDQRTPAWADLAKIRSMYAEARWLSVLMGEPYHVDHVIPLRGRRVSGLHAHTNLQILPGTDNVRKNNRFDP